MSFIKEENVQLTTIKKEEEDNSSLGLDQMDIQEAQHIDLSTGGRPAPGPGNNAREDRSFFASCHCHFINFNKKGLPEHDILGGGATRVRFVLDFANVRVAIESETVNAAGVSTFNEIRRIATTDEVGRMKTWPIFKPTSQLFMADEKAVLVDFLNEEDKDAVLETLACLKFWSRI